MKNPKVRQIVLPLITAMIWGSSFVTQSISAGHIGCFSFGALRALPATVCLFLLVCALHRLRPREKHSATQKKTLLFAGAICGSLLTAGLSFQQFGLTSTSAGKAGFISALYIVLVPVFSIFFGKKPGGRVWIFVAVAVAGLYLLCVNGSGEMSFSGGDLSVLLCAVVFAFQIIAVDHYAGKVDGVELSCVQFAVMTVLSAACALLAGEQTTMEAVKTCLPYILYTGIFSSGIAYTLQIIAQKDGDPTVVSLVLSLESLFAVVSGAIFLHERMSAQEYLGCALMLAAVLLSQLPEKSAKAVESGEKE